MEKEIVIEKAARFTLHTERVKVSRDIKVMLGKIEKVIHVEGECDAPVYSPEQLRQLAKHGFWPEHGAALNSKIKTNAMDSYARKLALSIAEPEKAAAKAQVEEAGNVLKALKEKGLSLADVMALLGGK